MLNNYLYDFLSHMPCKDSLFPGNLSCLMVIRKAPGLLKKRFGVYTKSPNSFS